MRLQSNSAWCCDPRGLCVPELLAVATRGAVTGVTRRPAATLLLSANGQPFTLHMPGLQALRGTSALIAPGQVRSLQAPESELLSLNIEPGHPRFRSLAESLAGRRARVFAPRHFDGGGDALRLGYEARRGAAAILGAIETLLDMAAGRPQPATERDRRVQHVLATLQADLPERPPLAALARSVGLSADRLSHLFVETMGMPLRSYMLWQRYRAALIQLPRCPSLTELANRCGFSDAAHMTRTFVGFFGVSPSRLRRSGFLQDFCAPT
ncbi:AraC family transcriptional regulator [Aquabacterium sp. A7-Y]|uniref:AraC family transcriptional regulator n=1 Tax=Aquabacterium sp. A7-Y TaxID=1349605 RepID=UPI00223E740F|nr:AraC family transcriptional regulator [Aquabacterium sp. A7-Y]MCW7537715.1 AraC family transcriptional regulator [Aquabacterium sp. A7-Y]